MLSFAVQSADNPALKSLAHEMHRAALAGGFTKMDAPLSVRTAVCTGYERLLEECQHALKIWNERRVEIHDSGLQGKPIDDELRKLQAKYAKAYTRLRNHVHDCETCKWVLEMERRSAYDSDPFETHRLSA